MLKTKYKFNPETLSYDRIELTVKERVSKLAITAIACTAGFTLIAFGIFTYFFDTTSYQSMQREKSMLISQYDNLDKKVKQLNAVLSDIQSRDDKIYRLMLETDPLPASIRNAGIGGTERYAHLKNYDNSELMIDITKKVDKLSKQLVVQSKSYDEVIELAKKHADKLTSIPALMPISKNKCRLSSYFGYRIHPILKVRKMHQGIDLTAARGTKVYAAGDGVIKSAKYYSGYGKQVVVNHKFGYETRYAHLSKILVRRGQKVKRGDLVGLVGSTGLSTAPHLHYEVLKNKKPINPVNYYFTDVNPEEYSKIAKRR